MNIKTNVVKRPFRLLVSRRGRLFPRIISVWAESLAAARQQLPDGYTFLALVKEGDQK